MDKPLPEWLIPWLYRPGWQLLIAQWLLLGGLAVLVGALSLRSEWQLRADLHAQHQRLEQQIDELQKLLQQMPPLEELEQRLLASVTEPKVPADLGTLFSQAGGRLLHWQRHDKSLQQKVKLQINYHGLLQLLAALPPTERLEQMAIEASLTGLTVQLVFLSQEGGADE